MTLDDAKARRAAVKARYRAKPGVREMERASASAYRANNRGALTERYLAGVKQNYAKTLAYRLATRCRNEGTTYSLTVEWFAERLLAGVCEATGETFDTEVGVGRGNIRRCGPSVDRVDHSQGYTPENCRLVTNHFNIARNRWSDADFQRMAAGFLTRTSTSPPTAAAPTQH